MAEVLFEHPSGTRVERGTVFFDGQQMPLTGVTVALQERKASRVFPLLAALAALSTGSMFVCAGLAAPGMIASGPVQGSDPAMTMWTGCCCGGSGMLLGVWALWVGIRRRTRYTATVTSTAGSWVVFESADLNETRTAIAALREAAAGSS